MAITLTYLNGWSKQTWGTLMWTEYSYSYEGKAWTAKDFMVEAHIGAICFYSSILYCRSENMHPKLHQSITKDTFLDMIEQNCIFKFRYIYYRSRTVCGCKLAKRRGYMVELSIHHVDIWPAYFKSPTRNPLVPWIVKSSCEPIIHVWANLQVWPIKFKLFKY